MEWTWRHLTDFRQMAVTPLGWHGAASTGGKLPGSPHWKPRRRSRQARGDNHVWPRQAATETAPATPPVTFAEVVDVDAGLA